jgi:hypothetical protein
MNLTGAWRQITMQAASPEPPSNSRLVVTLLEFMSGFDWNWLLYFVTGAMLTFAVILFATMFIKRWQMTRLGFFLFTGAAFVVRIARPDDKFWNIAAIVGAAVSVFLLVSVMSKGRLANKKEPIYYILNTATLILIFFDITFFTATMAAIALLASVFFLTTKAPSSPDKYKAREADPHILDSLQKRAQKR